MAHVAIAREGLVRICLPKRLYDSSPAPSNLKAPPSEVTELLLAVLEAMERAHAQLIDWSALPRVNLGTPFQNDVWKAIAGINPGDTITYGAIASFLNRPGAARAVGSACGQNPFPLLVPCHRVTSSNGLGGFSGDLAIKSELLAMERRLKGTGDPKP